MYRTEDGVAFLQDINLHEQDNQCLTCELAIVAAAIGRIYQFGVYTEEPAPRGINIGCLFNVHDII